MPNIFDFPTYEQMMAKEPVRDATGLIPYIEGVSGVGTVSAMDKMFKYLGYAQRGKPELAMREAQKFMGGGTVQHQLEHIGDLTNRFTGPNPGAYGKTRNWRDLSWKTLDEFKRNMKSNYDFFMEEGHPYIKNFKEKYPNFDDFYYKAKDYMKTYAEEHKKLPVFNHAQKLARDAAIDLGESRFQAAGNKVRQLDEWGKAGVLPQKLQYGEKMLKKKGLLD